MRVGGRSTASQGASPGAGRGAGWGARLRAATRLAGGGLADPIHDPVAQRSAAEALAARLPALLADAERIAATVAGGVHGRLRAGSGDSFWQYRPLTPGESTSRIDWRQSARGARLFVRETEWEAAQTVCLWCDQSASMRWRSAASLPEKRERAALIVLALSILLLRGGEHLGLLDDRSGRERFAGRQAAERLAARLSQRLVAADPGPTDRSLPVNPDLPRHARLVLIGDFLSPLAETSAMLAGLAAIPLTPLLVQLLDPAELSLPYDGRVRFEGVEGEAPELVAQAGDIREGYARAIAAHRSGLADLCARVGARLLFHRTDARPETLLLALHQAIAPRAHGAIAGGGALAGGGR